VVTLFPHCSLLWVSEIKPKSFKLHNTGEKSKRQTLFLYSRCLKLQLLRGPHEGLQGNPRAALLQQ